MKLKVQFSVTQQSKYSVTL